MFTDNRRQVAIAVFEKLFVIWLTMIVGMKNVH